MRFLLSIVALVGALTACAPAADATSRDPAPLMRWPDLTSQPLPAPDKTLRYASHDAGVIDLWLPAGPGPHPVVAMIHGGCWQKAIADRTLMNYIADDLRGRGWAVWNIEYRGVDETGGGYPGTFLDVASALDLLGSEGAEYNLRTENIVAIGHSAGGHLAVWAASRENIGEDSALHSASSLDLDLVINAGGLADLEASVPVTLPSCLSAIVDDLTGPETDARKDVFADTSPARLLPPSAKIVSVNGAEDGIAPPELGKAFTNAVENAGGTATYLEIPNTGHVELIAPGTAAWEAQIALIDQYRD